MAWIHDSRVCIEIAPAARHHLPPRRHAALLELLAGMALVVSIVIAATAVSINIARAETMTPLQASNDELVLVLCGGMLALALAVGALTAWMHRPQSH